MATGLGAGTFAGLSQPGTRSWQVTRQPPQHNNTLPGAALLWLLNGDHATLEGKPVWTPEPSAPASQRTSCDLSRPLWVATHWQDPGEMSLCTLPPSPPGCGGGDRGPKKDRPAGVASLLPASASWLSAASFHTFWQTPSDVGTSSVSRTFRVAAEGLTAWVSGQDAVHLSVTPS